MVDSAESTTGLPAPATLVAPIDPQTVSVATNLTNQISGDPGRYRLIQNFRDMI